MADRSLRFFMTPDEAAEVVARWCTAGGDVAVANARGDARLLDECEPLPERARFAYVGWPDLSDGRPDEVRTNPGAHAWARFSLPDLQGRVLHQACLDLRTQWLNHDNPRGLEVFQRASRVIRPLLHRPTYAWSIKVGGAAKVRDVGYTDGAREVFASGCEWLQEGVGNTRFGPELPDALGD